MADVVRANGTTVVEWLILVIFTLNFAWISTSFWTACIGFLLHLRGDGMTRALRGLLRGVEDDPIYSRCAVVVPIYNEDTARVFAGVETMARSLSASGQAGHFDLFVLSDTTKPEVRRAEERAIVLLRERMGEGCRVVLSAAARQPATKGRQHLGFLPSLGRRL